MATVPPASQVPGVQMGCSGGPRAYFNEFETGMASLMLYPLGPRGWLVNSDGPQGLAFWLAGLAPRVHTNGSHPACDPLGSGLMSHSPRVAEER